MNTEQKNSLSLPAAILLGAIIIALAVIWAFHPSNPTSPTTAAQNVANPSATVVDSSKIKTAGEPFIGSVTAPVTIAYWFDYQCPFCKQDEEAVLPQIITDYVKTGKVKIIFKDFAFLGPDSTTLAVAARAVWETAPDKFYDWHKAIFDAQGSEGSDWASPSEIMSVTTQVLGATDAAKVQSLMTSKATAYEAEITADKTEGSTLGVTGTPAMVIGKQLLVGAEPYSDIQAAIITALGS